MGQIIKTIFLSRYLFIARFNLNLTRKKLQKRALEAMPHESASFKYRLGPFYFFPENWRLLMRRTRMVGQQCVSTLGRLKELLLLLLFPSLTVNVYPLLTAFSYKGFFAWGSPLEHSLASYSMKHL